VTSTERGRRKYDEIAERYEDIFFYVGEVGQQLVDFADPAPGSRVLDVGAGRGAVARAALARGCVVTAVDASARMVELLGADFPEFTVRQLDAGRLDFADGSFDLVTAGFLVQVLDDPAAAIAEVRRVLVPAGLFALSLERQSVGRLHWLQELGAEFFARAPQQPPTADTTAADTTAADTPTAEAADTPAADTPAADTPTAEATTAARAAGPLTDEDLTALLADAGFVNPARQFVEMPVSIADPATLWDWLIPRGLADALQRIPADRNAEFRRKFLAGAERMHADGGIVLDVRATLHRAHAPGRR
jgi:ubiquinone/menaquinone biosynthesis C-methylase UbiE